MTLSKTSLVALKTCLQAWALQSSSIQLATMTRNVWPTIKPSGKNAWQILPTSRWVADLIGMISAPNSRQLTMQLQLLRKPALCSWPNSTSLAPPHARERAFTAISVSAPRWSPSEPSPPTVSCAAQTSWMTTSKESEAFQFRDDEHAPVSSLS